MIEVIALLFIAFAGLSLWAIMEAGSQADDAAEKIFEEKRK